MGCMSGLFVMNRSGWIAVVEPSRAFYEILTIAGFIAHRPHDDARMVFVAFHHILNPVEVGLEPGRILRKRFFFVTHAVGFNVSLGNYIESKFIANLDQ